MLASVCKATTWSLNSLRLSRRKPIKVFFSDCSLGGQNNKIQLIYKRLKNENEELRMEREQLKFAETDPKKKGNSLFAELEDNRQELEKRVISLTSKLSALKKECDFKTQQIRKLKIDVSSLLAMTSNAEDVKYQKYIEDSLVSAMNQISSLTNKLEELEEQSDKQKYLEYKKLFLAYNIFWEILILWNFLAKQHLISIR
ncbi:Protein Spindly-B [Armadillidium nasatum]|uniref:Protein Spindly-B n=1 Tax=Armadillidium nasatum TaxID=96803 RepID=A0A5N5TKT2_9CRUS|nr:Protein Spindly-B [Armadillidium nasatum]